MATNTTSAGFDASGMLDQAVSQFRGLKPTEPGQWPWMPKVAVFLDSDDAGWLTGERISASGGHR